MQDNTDRQLMVAHVVRTLRDASGASNKQLAEWMDIHPSGITDRLKSENPTKISLDDLHDLCGFFDIGIDVLWMSPDELDKWLTMDRVKQLRVRVALLPLDLRDRSGNTADQGNPKSACMSVDESRDLVGV